jgi:hypothetical protein
MQIDKTRQGDARAEEVEGRHFMWRKEKDT